MDWPDTMKRDGCVVHRPEMEVAWKQWLEGDRTSTRMAGCLNSAGAKNVAGVKRWVFHRLADGMLQHARKAGEIRYHNGRWMIAK